MWCILNRSYAGMQAYKELSAEMGRRKRLEAAGGGGTEASRAGKMRSRRSGAHASWVDSVAGRERSMARRLQKAACDSTYEEVLELVQKGAPVGYADSKGRTALHFAACRGDANLVKLLVSHGALVNQKDCNGNTALHLASCTHHVAVVTALLDAGTDVSAVDFRGVTPLHLALSRLKIMSEKEGAGEGEGGVASVASSRKREIVKIADMIKSYLRRTDLSEAEATELERLTGRLSLSESKHQVDEVQGLLESFTSLSIARRNGREQ